MLGKLVPQKRPERLLRPSFFTVPHAVNCKMLGDGLDADDVAVETKSVDAPHDATERTVVDAENDLRCPICDSSLPTMRAVRTHLRSGRHNVSLKTKLTELITLTRERSRKRAYQGGLAKNILIRVKEEKAATAVDFQIVDKTLNMRFGVNSDGRMVVTKVSPKSCLYDRRSQLVGARLVSLGGVDVETREKVSTRERSEQEVGSSYRVIATCRFACHIDHKQF